MKVHEAILSIDHQELSERHLEAREVLEASLAEVSPEDFETRGTYYYYLLRIALHGHLLFETEIEKHFYKKMSENFEKQDFKYNELLRKNPDEKVIISQMNAFYRLIGRYFTMLTAIYEKKGYHEGEDRAYLETMKYRLRSYKSQKKYWKQFGYTFWNLTSLYGLSFARWGMSCGVAIVFYAFIFLVSGGVERASGIAFHWYDSIHFSIATFTTLGFGDVVPITLFAKIVADIEVFNGYLMLGVFMALVQKRLH